MNGRIGKDYLIEHGAVEFWGTPSLHCELLEGICGPSIELHGEAGAHDARDETMKQEVACSRDAFRMYRM